jgi:hypothetical protein
METRLRARRSRATQELPPLEEILRGTVLGRELRCGKGTCRCASGDPHRATYLSVTLAGGRTEQISLPAALVPLATRWVANYRRWWEMVEKVSAINRQILRLRRAARKKGASAPSRRSGQPKR